MANNSLKAAFERFWMHVTTAVGEKQDRISYGSTPPTGGTNGDVYLQIIDTLPIINGGTNADNIITARENLEATAWGASLARESIESLWTGNALTAEFTVDDITKYKYFIVQDGTVSGVYATNATVHYSPDVNGGSFRGMNGYVSSSGNTEIHGVLGTVSDNTVTISKVNAKLLTSTAIYSSTDLYIKAVWGVK